MRPGYTTWCFPVITIDRDTNSAYGDGLMLNLHSAAGIIMVLSVWIIIVLIHICYALVSGNVRWIMRQRGKVGDDDNNAEAPVGDSIISVVLDGDTTEFPQLQQQQQQQQQNKVHLVPPDPVTGSKEQLFRLCWAVMASVIFAWVPLAALLAIKLTNNSGEWLFEFVAVYLHSVDMMLAPVVLVRFHRGYRGFVYSTIVPESMRRLYILRLILGKEPT